MSEEIRNALMDEAAARIGELIQERDRLRAENKALRAAFGELSELFVQVVESCRPLYAMNSTASENAALDAKLTELRTARAALNGEEG